MVSFEQVQAMPRSSLHKGDFRLDLEVCLLIQPYQTKTGESCSGQLRRFGTADRGWLFMA